MLATYTETTEYKIYQQLCDLFNDEVDNERFIKTSDLINSLKCKGEGGVSKWDIPDGSKEFLVNLFMFVSIWDDTVDNEDTLEGLISLKEKLYSEYMWINNKNQEHKDKGGFEEVNTEKYLLTFLYDIAISVVTDLKNREQITPSEMVTMKDLFRVLFVKCSEQCLPF